MDLAAFQADEKTISAVERKLQVLSEAATRLGSNPDAICPGPRWRDIRGIGNWLRHQYDVIDVAMIWNTLQNDLPPLKEAVIKSLNLSPASGADSSPRM